MSDSTMIIPRRNALKRRLLAAKKAAQPLPPIHLCRLRYCGYVYLTGYDGDAVVIRECPNEKDFEGDWKNGRTICCEKKERAQEVFALCALLRFFADEIRCLDDATICQNETVNKALSKLVAERRCRPSDLLIQIEPGQEFYTGKENRVSETDKPLQFVKLFRDYANDGAAGKGTANHEGK